MTPPSPRNVVHLAEPIAYRSPTPPAPADSNLLAVFLAALFSGAALGTLFLYLFFNGLGLGDTWIFNPYAIPTHYWLTPLAMLSWPTAYFLWRRRRTGRWLEPLQNPISNRSTTALINTVLITMVTASALATILTLVGMLGIFRKIY